MWICLGWIGFFLVVSTGFFVDGSQNALLATEALLQLETHTFHVFGSTDFLL